MGKRLATIVAVVTVLLAQAPARAEDLAPEDTVKATFVSRFASFVAWPADAFTTPDAPIEICVFGAPTMQIVLREVVRSQTAGARGFTVRSIQSMVEASRCHILYASTLLSSEELRPLQNLPVLTVTDASYGTGARGIIHFAVVDHRVRFHIDDAYAANAGLTISSRLLLLALSVRQRSPS